MSHDFLVAMRKRPAPASIDDFGRAAGLDLRTTGSFRPDSNALVTAAAGPAERTIDVDGPVRVEPDDLPDDLAGVVTRPTWLVEIHLPGGYDETVDRWALDLAIHLARAGDGAVFDPQSDHVVWPSGVTPRKRGGTEERIRTVQLVWFLPASRVGPDTAGRWLDLVNEHFPAAAPVRFGASEPLTGRMDKDGPGAFVEEWKGQEFDWGGMLFWSAKSPGLDGSVSFADRRADRRPDRLGRAVRLSTMLDARPLHRDKATCDAVVKLFAEVADGLGAFYAGGCVLRDAIMKRGRIGYGRDSEFGPMPRTKWWVGLPALPTWLAWFGEPYRRLVESQMDGSMVEVRPSGLLLRCGAEPMDIDALQGVFPDLPPEIRVTRRSGAPVDPATRISMTLEPPSGPAATIPPID